MMVNLENTHGSFHPFEMFRNALTDVDLCGSCRPRAQLHVHAIELDLWKRLPAIFDLVCSANIAESLLYADMDLWTFTAWIWCVRRLGFIVEICTTFYALLP